ncbi:MAG: adenosylcobinamide-GDP ribazoletransferase [Rhizobiales bacterium]|nr:adenosylcobinamide-GDP ribazoletransferase [Hyphomicrobiales bacterium]
MRLRGLLVALQFLTRLPVPAIPDVKADDLTRSAAYYPLVGFIIGLVVAGAALGGALVEPWLGALAGLLAWVWVTGGLHLDGLADVSDALGAAHGGPERFTEVLRDPRIGSFGAQAIALQIAGKLVLLAVLLTHLPGQGVAGWLLAGLALALVPAWARFGTLVWSLTVPPYREGLGARFSKGIDRRWTLGSGIGLGLVSAVADPVLLAALAIILLHAVYWRRRLGGITGDCLGASVEVTETMLLAVLAVAAVVMR